MNLLNVACALPKKYEAVMDAAARLNIPKEQAKVLQKLFGLNRLPIDLEMKAESLMIDASNQCIDAMNIHRDQIKYVIHAHTAPHGHPFGGSTVMNVQRKLQLNKAISFGTTLNKCASVFMSFKIAQQLFHHLTDDDFILILTGDVTFTPTLQFIPGTTIMSDGAAAILLAKKNHSNHFIGIELDVHGQYAGGIWDPKEVHQAFEQHYSVNLANVIKRVVNKSGLSLSAIKLILPHNVNTISWMQVIKLLDIPANQVFLDNVKNTAHGFGADPFFNFQTAIEKKLIQKNEYFIFATVGLGATFAAMLFQH